MIKVLFMINWKLQVLITIGLHFKKAFTFELQMLLLLVADTLSQSNKGDAEWPRKVPVYHELLTKRRFIYHIVTKHST